jgi:hypothetical protein
MVDVTCAPIVVYVFVPWDVPGDLKLSKLVAGDLVLRSQMMVWPLSAGGLVD